MTNLSALNPASSTRTEIRVDGMECDACVSSITKALKALPGVTNVSVDLGTGRVVVERRLNIPDLDSLRNAVEDAGFDFEGLVE